MPDESCRTCGGVLISCSMCPECRKIIQWICRQCGSKTAEQFHDRCLYIESITSRNGMEMEVVISPQLGHKSSIYRNNSKNHTLRDSLLVFGVVGFFVLGVAFASYSDLFESLTGEAQTIKPTILKDGTLEYHNKHFDTVYENCLGDGAAQSITVTCPNGKGSVYKAILAMPHELAAKFANDIFSIRGISLNESSDGSVILEYVNKFYSTSFLETEGKV
ncbi:MAG: hypothetical protein ACT4N5_03350 [Nitrosopumilaceae archaeon]